MRVHDLRRPQLLCFVTSGLGHYIVPLLSSMCLTDSHHFFHGDAVMTGKSHDRILGQGLCASTPPQALSAQGVWWPPQFLATGTLRILSYRAMFQQTLLPRSDLLPTEVWGTQYNYALPEMRAHIHSTRWRPHINCVLFYALPTTVIWTGLVTLTIPSFLNTHNSISCRPDVHLHPLARPC
jgi:hypothetical protein